MKAIKLPTVLLISALGICTAPLNAHSEPSVAAKTYHTEGVRQFKGKKFKEAISNFKRAVKFAPDFAAAWLDLANAQLALKDFGKAEEAFTKAIKFNPTVAVAHYNLAYVLRKLGSNSRAVESYEKYVAMKPQDADAFYGMAEALKASGQNPKAAQAYRRYAELENRPGRKKWREKALVEAEALAKATPASTSEPGSTPSVPAATPASSVPTVAETKAPAITAAKQTKPAATAPKQTKPAAKTDVFASTLNREKPPAPKATRPAEFGLAIKAIQDKQFEAAMMQLKVALGKSPSDPLILAALGSIHLGREDPLAAIESYSRALKAAPENARASIELGLAEAYRLNDDEDEAAELYRKLLRNPKVPAPIREVASKNIAFVD